MDLQAVIKCDKHSDRSLEIFCADCMLMICSRCLKDHLSKSHRVMDYDEYFEQLKENGLIEVTNNKIKESISYKESQKSFFDIVQSDHLNQLGVISKSFKDIHSLLNRKEDRLKKDLESIYSYNDQLHLETISRVENSINKMKHSLELLKIPTKPLQIDKIDYINAHSIVKTELETIGFVNKISNSIYNRDEYYCDNCGQSLEVVRWKCNDCVKESYKICFECASTRNHDKSHKLIRIDIGEYYCFNCKELITNGIRINCKLCDCNYCDICFSNNQKHHDKSHPITRYISGPDIEIPNYTVKRVNIHNLNEVKLVIEKIQLF